MFFCTPVDADSEGIWPAQPKSMIFKIGVIVCSSSSGGAPIRTSLMLVSILSNKARAYNM